MSTNVLFWLVPWAGVTTVVLVLLVWRMVAAEHDTIRIAPGNPSVVEEEIKLTRLDFWGKAFTIAFVLLLVNSRRSLYLRHIHSGKADSLAISGDRGEFS